MKINLKIKEKIKFLIPGILFYATLSMFFKSMGFSMSAVVLLFLISAASAFWITGYRFLAMIPSVIFAVGSVAFLLTIGQSPLQEYFIDFASLLFMVTTIALWRFFTPEEERPDEKDVALLDTGFNLNQAMIIFSLFFLSSGVYGIYITTSIRPWQMLLIISAGIYLSGFYLIRINFLKSQELELHLDYYKNRTFNFYSFLLPLVMIELIWVITYLPINQLTFGAIVVVMFYCYWSIIRSYLRNELTRSKFIGCVSFSVVVVLTVFLTSKLYIN